MVDPNGDGPRAYYDLKTCLRESSMSSIRITAGATPAVTKDGAGIVASVAKTATGRVKVTFNARWQLIFAAYGIKNTTDSRIYTVETYGNAEATNPCYLEFVTRDAGLATDLALVIDIHLTLCRAAANS